MFAFLKKYYFGLILLTLEVLLLIGAASSYVKDEEKFSHAVSYKDMDLTVWQDDRGGWYIDDTFVPGYSGLFTYGGAFDLPKGSYTVTVSYETDMDGNYLIGNAETESYNAFWCDKIPFNSMTGSITFDIWVWEDTEVEFQTYFGGEGYLIFRNIELHQTNATCKMLLTLTVLGSALVDLIYVLAVTGWFRRQPRERLAVVCFLFLIGLYASIPMLSMGIYPRDDMGNFLLRIEGIRQALSEGQFPVRMQPVWSYGYGYAVSVYYCDIFMYFPGILRLLGIPFQYCLQSYVVLLNVVTAGVAYFCMYRITGKRSVALVAALAYTAAPMRQMEFYPRGAFGEGTAMTFLPLIFLGMWKIYTEDIRDKRFKHYWIYLSLGFAGLLSCHILSTYVTGILVLLICLFMLPKTLKWARLSVLLKSVSYAVLMTFWFLFPMITNMGVIQGTDSTIQGAKHIQQSGLNLSQLFNLFYNPYGELYEATRGPAGEDACGVGLTILLMALVFFGMYMLTGRENKTLKNALFPFIIGAFIIFMTTCYFPWDYISGLAGSKSMFVTIIQFPWRLSIVAIALFLFVGGIGISTLLEKNRITGMAVLTAIAVLSIVGSSHGLDAYVNSVKVYTVYDIAAIGKTNNNLAEYLISGTDITLLTAGKTACGEGVSMTSYEKAGTRIRMSVMNAAATESYVEVPLLWYPWYECYDVSTDERLEIVKGDNNVLRVLLPFEYAGDIMIRYTQPTSWKIATAISILTWIGLILTAILRLVRAKRKEAAMPAISNAEETARE